MHTSCVKFMEDRSKIVHHSIPDLFRSNYLAFSHDSFDEEVDFSVTTLSILSGHAGGHLFFFLKTETI